MAAKPSRRAKPPARRGRPASGGKRAQASAPQATVPPAARSEAATPAGEGQLPAAFRRPTPPRLGATKSPVLSPAPPSTAHRSTPTAARQATAPARATAAPAQADSATRVPEQPFVALKPVLVRAQPAGPVEVVSWTCDPIRDVEPQGLGVTYWFDAAATGDPYPVSVRFTGRRVSPAETGGPDTFQVVHTLDRVIPGSGRVALSARIPGITAGEWEVTATPLPGPTGGRPGTPAGRPPDLLPTGTATGTTTYLPVARMLAPGVRVGAWPTLVGSGAALALVLQALLAAQRGLPVGRLLLISLTACLIGLLGAKVYYLLTHPQETGGLLRAGMSVQGFVLAALTTLVLGSGAADIPVGTVLDVTAPGLLFGMTIGRLGCLLGGCCTGLPTASRWGIWSSDRRVGVRRIPVQLLESALAGVVGTATLVAVLSVDPAVDGLLLVAGLSAYIAGRQILFPLRGIPRDTSWGRVTTLTVSLLVLAAAVTVLIATGSA